MRISIFGSYGEKNLGDEAICDSVIGNVLEVYKGADIVIFSHDVEETKRIYKNQSSITVRPVIASGFRSFIDQVRTKDFQESAKIIRESDFVIIGGGGLFYDTELKVGINPILVWLIRVMILRYLKVKIIIYAIGVGPVKSIFSKVYLRIIGNSADRITVRDKYSEKLLKSCNVYTPIIVTSDPVWTRGWEVRTMQDISRNPVLKVDGRRKIGIQVRPVRGVKEADFILLITDFIDRMVEKYLLSVVLIPMSLESPNDKLLMEKIQINSSYESNIEVYDTKDYNSIPQVMQECESLVVSRMHSIIIATQLGIPFIALSYSPKTDDLIRRLTIGDYAWPIHDIETSVLERLYLRLIRRRVTVRSHLLDMAMTMKEEAKKNLKLITS